ncbi:hypothetical protein TSMEX_003361 [Taenia solium]|eukprot:TsM_000952900 transcript=TsM_000952900 gene=TsM_000952900
MPCYFLGTGAEPVLWSSRIVGTAEGPSPPMYFALPKRPIITALWEIHTSSAIHAGDGTCYVGDQVLGSPCQMDAESADITVNDVSREEAVNVWGEGGLFLISIFVPKCNFQKSERGEWRELEKGEQQLYTDINQFFRKPFEWSMGSVWQMCPLIPSNI